VSDARLLDQVRFAHVSTSRCWSTSKCSHAPEAHP